MGVEVYEACLDELREASPNSEEAFNLLSLRIMRNAYETLRKKDSSIQRILNFQHRLDQILTGHTEYTKAQLTQRLNEWYQGEEIKGRLTIQRISGECLPMASCYINLAVVAYRNKQDKQNKQASSKSLFHRLASAEELIHTNLNELIPLEELFKPRRLKDGTEDIPKRILIRGRAGIGKTTLAKKSVYEHIQHGLWQEHFNRALWIPLHHLKGKEHTYHLETFLYDEHFKGRANGHALAEALYQAIQSVKPG